MEQTYEQALAGVQAAIDATSGVTREILVKHRNAMITERSRYLDELATKQRQHKAVTAAWHADLARRLEDRGAFGYQR